MPWLVAVLYRVRSCLGATVHCRSFKMFSRCTHSSCNSVSSSLVGRSRTPSDLLTRSCPIPRGMVKPYASISSYMQTKRRRSRKWDIVWKIGEYAIGQPTPETVNFSSVPRFALFTRVCLFPFVPLFNSPMDMLSGRHKHDRDYRRSWWKFSWESHCCRFHLFFSLLYILQLAFNFIEIVAFVVSVLSSAIRK